MFWQICFRALTNIYHQPYLLNFVCRIKNRSHYNINRWMKSDLLTQKERRRSVCKAMSFILFSCLRLYAPRKIFLSYTILLEFDVGCRFISKERCFEFFIVILFIASVNIIFQFLRTVTMWYISKET